MRIIQLFRKREKFWDKKNRLPRKGRAGCVPLRPASGQKLRADRIAQFGRHTSPADL